jgi:putative Mn2+ efflux pump MntP
MNILRELTKPRGHVEPDLIVRRPIREAVLLTLLALGAAFLTVDVGDLVSAVHEKSSYLPLLFTVLAVGCIAFAYAFLGARIGTRRASTIIKVLITATVLPVLIVLAARALLGL